jgi:hypothetical protein
MPSASSLDPRKDNPMSTYGLPAEITAQTLFDKAVVHLFEQGRPAYVHRDGRKTSTCAYRGGGTTACAVGCLIPDDRYVPEMEEHTVEDDIVRNIMPELQPFELMLYDVQSVHDTNAARDTDGAFVRDSLAQALIHVAERHGLSRAVIDAKSGF